MKILLLGNIEERVTHLLADVEELQINAEKSGMAFQNSSNFFDIVKDIELSDGKNISIFIKSVRQFVSSQLEFMRDRISIIQKISPKTAEHLHNIVNKHEKYVLDVLSMMEKNSNPSKLEKLFERKETQSLFVEMTNNINMANSAVDNCYQCLIDTLEFISGTD
jgi:hypothetical protein